MVLTGNGRAFSAGGDFEYLEQQHYDVEAAPRLARHRPAPRHQPGESAHPADRRRQRPGGGPRLQHRGPVRRRVHGRERAPGRSPRGGGPGSGRWRRPHLAAAHQPPAGQGVRLHRRSHLGPAGGRDRAGQPRRARRRDRRPGGRAGPPDGQAAPPGAPGHQADPQPPARAGGHGRASTSPSPPRSARSAPTSCGPTSSACARGRPRTPDSDGRDSGGATSRSSLARSAGPLGARGVRGAGAGGGAGSPPVPCRAAC